MSNDDTTPLTPEERAAFAEFQRFEDRMAELSIRLQEADDEDLTGYLEAVRDEVRSLAEDGPLAPLAAHLLAMVDMMIGTSIRQDRIERELAVLQQSAIPIDRELSEISERIARLEAQR